MPLFHEDQQVWHVEREAFVIITRINPQGWGEGWYMVDMGDGELVPAKESELRDSPLVHSPRFLCLGNCQGLWCVCKLLRLSGMARVHRGDSK